MDIYGLLGYPLGHSFSKGFFNEKFALEHIDAEYRNYELPAVEQIKDVVAVTPLLRGFNVTIPYKEQVIPLLDELAPEAVAIGAVNVVKVLRQDGEPYLKGYNTDVIGFTDSIRPLLKPHHQKALVLGTGGASKAVVFGLQQVGLSCQLVSRKANASCITYEEITPALLQDYTVVVNTTPLGMYPRVETYPPIPYESLTSQHLLFDLHYNPETTLFMKLGARQGACTQNGLEMLIGQARAAWKIWTE